MKNKETLESINEKKTMLDYINETPVACKNILAKRKEIAGGFVKCLSGNEIKRVVLVACGSSFNGSTSARLFVEKVLQLPTVVVTPFMFTNYEQFYTKNDVIITISESGRSTSAIDATKKAVAEGLNCMVLTNDLDSPITKECKDVICLSCGVETVGYVTKGYASTIFVVMLLALEGALALKKISQQEYDRIIGQFNAAIEIMPKVIEDGTAWYQANKADLMNIKRPMFVSYGPNSGTALEGALKVQETIKVPSTAFELEEFMHGPNLELKADHSVFFINTAGKAEKRLLDLFALMPKITKETYLVTHGPKSSNTKVLAIDHQIDEEISPLFMAIPFQLISHYLIVDLKIEEKGKDQSVENIFTLSKVSK